MLTSSIFRNKKKKNEETPVFRFHSDIVNLLLLHPSQCARRTFSIKFTSDHYGPSNSNTPLNLYVRSFTSNIEFRAKIMSKRKSFADFAFSYRPKSGMQNFSFTGKREMGLYS